MGPGAILSVYFGIFVSFRVSCREMCDFHCKTHAQEPQHRITYQNGNHSSALLDPVLCRSLRRREGRTVPFVGSIQKRWPQQERCRWGGGSWGLGEGRSTCFMRSGLFRGWGRCAGTRQREQLPNTVSGLNARELYTWQRLILCDVNLSQYFKEENRLEPVAYSISHLY